MKVSMLQKTSDGEQFEIYEDDFSMLSMQPKAHQVDQSTLPLEAVEFSPQKSYC
jgi:hypothetical protein